MKFQIQQPQLNYALHKNSPKILMFMGIVSSVAAVVTAVKATTKLDDILENSKSELEKIDNYCASEDRSEEYSDEDATKDRAIIRTKTALKIAGLYAPAVALEVMSIGCFMGSNKILNQRNLALSAAAKAVDEAFKDYRGEVRKRFGDEVDKELRYKIFEEEKEFEEVGKDGKTKKKKEKVKVSKLNDHNEFTRIFDETNPQWTKGSYHVDADGNYYMDGSYNKVFILNCQEWANRKLRKEGFVTINDVYDRLGFKRTEAAAIAGWVWSKDDPTCQDDTHIDFGLFDIHDVNKSAFVNNEERSVILDFNYDTLNVWEYVK